MSDDANENGASREDIVEDDDLVRAAAELADESEPEVVPKAEPVVEPELEPEPKVEVEPVELEPEPGVEPDETLTPQESTRLGRKVAAIDERMTDMFDRMDQVLGRVEGQSTEAELEAEEDLDKPQLFTPREVSRMVQSEKALDVKAREGFEDDIAKQGSLAKDNDEMFGKVCDEISANFMPKEFRKASAELIYAKAKNIVLSKQLAQPLGKVNPLKGEEPENPLGTLPEEVVPVREVPEIKLTEDEIKGAEGLGVSKEQFKKFIAEGGGEDLSPSKGSGTPL